MVEYRLSDCSICNLEHIQRVDLYQNFTFFGYYLCITNIISWDFLHYALSSIVQYMSIQIAHA